MTPLARQLPFLTTALLLVVAMPRCTFTVGLDYLENGQCASGTKLCESHCEGPDPDNGCSSAGCIPCSLKNATARCGGAGQCAIAACIGTNQDCNGVADDGCEIDTDHDPQHCGDCDAPACVVPNATPDCAAGRCAVRSCNSGFDDCNGLAADGCETTLGTDSSNCGKCKTICPSGTTCQSGTCL